MGRPTKQAKATRQLLEMVLSGLDATGLADVDTYTLIASATSLAVKVGDRQEQVLLEEMLAELSNRDLSEVGAGGLLSAAVSIISKGGERAKDNEMKRSELAAEASTDKPVKKRVRC